MTIECTAMMMNLVDVINLMNHGASLIVNGEGGQAVRAMQNATLYLKNLQEAEKQWLDFINRASSASTTNGDANFLNSGNCHGDYYVQQMENVQDEPLSRIALIPSTTTIGNHNDHGKGEGGGARVESSSFFLYNRVLFISMIPPNHGNTIGGASLGQSKTEMLSSCYSFLTAVLVFNMGIFYMQQRWRAQCSEKSVKMFQYSLQLLSSPLTMVESVAARYGGILIPLQTLCHNNLVGLLSEFGENDLALAHMRLVCANLAATVHLSLKNEFATARSSSLITKEECDQIVLNINCWNISCVASVA